MTQPSPQPEPPLQPSFSFGPDQPETTGQNPPPPPSASAGPVWFQRLSLFIRVLFCIYLGAIITVLPWWTALWDQNAYLLAHPHLWAILRPGPVRGIISGLGLLDIWIGITEAVHYRDQKSHELPR